MDLKERLRTDLTAAMRGNDTQRRDVLRMVLAAVKQIEIDSRVTLDDAGVQDVLRRQVKQRQESICLLYTSLRDVATHSPQWILDNPDRARQLLAEGTNLADESSAFPNPYFARLEEIAVSYTHLDVYKRQARNTPVLQTTSGW